ncbi:hypothetical protein HPB52_008237 [Rhipicephalus sanguineus]|uniref:Uncharacterized protein n=1 Tax=Rhipicephalus sanguineus TaxID=34632 RepID=A0A9D4SU10_RHISA|nr:hypothetical protein HPB52_008237 [Rhipicephalus sanguineus]
MAEGAFVEGDQAPRDKDPEELDLQQRVPSRLVEEHGDDALRQPPHAELDSSTLSPQHFNEAALDEGLMLRELLKKGRLKNPTLTEKGAPLQLLEDRRLSALLEVTQNIALRHQLRGTVQLLSQDRRSQEASEKPVGIASISEEMSGVDENARSTLGHTDGAHSCLPASGPISDGTRTASPNTAKKSAVAPSPSQLDAGRVESRLAEPTLEKSGHLRAGDDVCRKPSKFTQIVTGASSGVATDEAATTPQPREHVSLSSPSRLEQTAPAEASSEESDDRIQEMPVLDVLDKCDLVELSSYIRRARRRRCYGTDVGSCSSDSERSLVKMDFSTLPTEASEMVAERRCGREACNEPTRADGSTTSTSSWYSFDAPSGASRRSSGLRAAASESAGSWAARRQGLSTSPDVPSEILKASSLIRFFESKN